MNRTANPDGADAQAVIDSILAIVRERTGCDFSRYRAATVGRRIRNRMISLGITGFAEYLKLVETVEDETLRLLERVTIKVSRFYRNSPTFELLRRQLIPELVRARGGLPLRVWSAGCGYGEEAYTLAMLLDEAGADGIVEASDIDRAALAVARTGVYRADAVAELPADLLARYLEAIPRGGVSYRVRDSLRRRLRFSYHDLTAAKPAPGAGVFDLICCRNVLIYLQRDTQERTLHRLRQALAAGGLLCLGEAEWPPAALVATLAPLGRKTCLFRALENFAEGETR